MSTINWLRAAYTKVVEAGCVTTLVVILIVGIAQVFFRYVVGSSLTWSEEFLRYATIWMVMAGAGLAYSRGEMIGLDFIAALLPRSARIAVEIFVGIVGMALFAVVAWYGVSLSLRMSASMATALDIPMIYINISIPVGSVILLFHILLKTLSAGQESKPDGDALV